MQLKEKAHNPHNAFFQVVMGNKKPAIDFFKNYLPADILKLVDIILDTGFRIIGDGS